MRAGPTAELSQALRALADPNRRAILEVIGVSPCPVGAIAERVGISQQTASHHLSVLQSAGMAVSQRDGTRHLFAINRGGLASIRSYLDSF